MSAEKALQRGLVYRFLSIAFSAPGHDFAGTVVPLLTPSLTPSRRLQDFMTEHSQLFVVPGRLYIPPYESVYTGDTPGQLWGEPTLCVLKEYMREGLKPARAEEPPDHIVCEMDFMRHLCEKESLAWEGGDCERARAVLEAEARFLKEHLLQWIPAFAAKVRASGTGYAGLADMTERYVMLESRDIDIILAKGYTDEIAPEPTELLTGNN
ncbi:MAG TPA: molecular chaperone TorD family protein [Candidatus Methanoperedenaceae archaeon]|nr:molecular chaperone TorD family protein [Candidatus Methanoperedenaceae archaeon]